MIENREFKFLEILGHPSFIFDSKDGLIVEYNKRSKEFFSIKEDEKNYLLDIFTEYDNIEELLDVISKNKKFLFKLRNHSEKKFLKISFSSIKNLILLIIVVEKNQFFANSPDIMYITDNKNCLTYVNSSIEKKLGADRSYFVGKDFFSKEFVHPDDMEKLELELKIVKNQKKSKTFEIRFKKIDDYDYLWFSNSLFPDYDDEGNVIGLRGIARDITQTVRMASNLSKRNLELITINSISTSAQTSLNIESILNNFIRTFINFYKLDIGIALFSIQDDSSDVDIIVDYKETIARNILLEKSVRIEDFEKIELLNSEKNPEKRKNPLLKELYDMGLPYSIIIPLRVKEFGKGFIILSFSKVEKLDDFSYTLISTIRSQLNISLENAIHYYKERKKLEYITTLHNVSKNIINLDNEQELLNILEKHILKFVEVDRISSIILSSEDTFLVYSSDNSISLPCDNKTIDIESDKIFSDILSNIRNKSGGKSLYRDTKNGDGIIKSLRENGINYFFSIPLMDNNNTLGYLSFGTIKENGFTEEERNFFMDISHLTFMALFNIKLKNKLIEHGQTIKNKNNELQEFIYTISHDLKTPLFSILGFINILEEDYGENFDPSISKYLTRIAYNAQKMDEQIKELLSLSKVGTYKLLFENIELREFFNNIKRSLELKIKKKNGNIKFNIDDMSIENDKFLLTHIMENLIDNALKYTPDDRTPSIEINCHKLYKNGVRLLEISVKDNGIGIDKNSFDKIFTVFSRLNKLKKVEGSGTGLTIVKRMVEKLGGIIWLDSEINVGTIFHIELPLKNN